MKKESILDKYIRNVSSLKTKPKKVRTVSYMDIERLNSSIEKKIRQNESERIASMIAGAKCIVN